MAPSLRLPIWGRLLLAVMLCSPPSAPAQKAPHAPLSVSGSVPEGVRGTATESWGLFRVNLINWDEADRQAGVFLHYEGQDNLQYGRTAWVPARSQLATWLLVGPAPPQGHQTFRDIRTLLYDRTGGSDLLILPPGEERVRPRGVSYVPRQPFVAIFLDEQVGERLLLGKLPQPDSPDDESIQLARGPRYVQNLSQVVALVSTGTLPPVAEAYDGVDNFIIAATQISRDVAGQRALRQWVEQGGKLWVMLDRVDPEGLAPLLGPALDFQVVDHTRLSHFCIRTASGRSSMDGPPQEHERPVAFTRVLLPPGEQARHTINDWPVWFTRPLGRGKIVFTTLGPRGWFRARTRRDKPSPFISFPKFPIPDAPLEDLTFQLQAEAKGTGFKVESLQPLLNEEIGYAVMGRTSVALILGSFLLAALTLGLALRWARRPEWLGWLGPLAALAAAGVLLGLGQASHRAAPPTLAVAEIIDAVGGEREAGVHGLLAVYQPASGALEAGVTQGGLFQLDLQGTEGEIHRLVRTDLDAWHWDNVNLPGGVRVAPFRGTVPIDRPLEAVAHFGPDGLEGRLNGPITDPTDALLTVPGARNLTVHVEPDGTFRATPQDVLPRGQLLAETVLSDRQQRRQEVYRELLRAPSGTFAGKGNVLLAWGRPLDMHFHFAPLTRTTGSALFVLPLRMERSAAGQRVTVPAPFVSYQRLLQNSFGRPTVESSEAADMHLRFQLPAEVLPLQVERARLAVVMEAPGRSVRIAAQENDRFVEVRQVETPLDPIRVEINEPRFLRLDEQGGLHLRLNIGAVAQEGPPGRAGAGQQTRWAIDYLELEVSGRTQGRAE